MHTASVKTALGVKLFLRALRAWCIISELSVWTRPCPATPRRLPQETGFDQRIDHRQENFESRGIRAIIMTIKYPGVAQLVARLLWEQDAAGSNPVTRTMRSVLIGSEYPVTGTPHFLFPILYRNLCRGVDQCYAFSRFQQNIPLRDFTAIRHLKHADAPRRERPAPRSPAGYNA